MQELFKIENYSLFLNSDGKRQNVITSANLKVGRGEVVGLIGESGSGKSMLWKSLLGLADPVLWTSTGSFKFDGRVIGCGNEKDLAPLRGKEIAVIMQDTMSSFDQLFTIEEHFIETARIHTNWTRKETIKKAIDLLLSLNIRSPEKVLKMYPFQCSGGMLQRIMIAIALMLNPSMIIADEPTTSVDVTAQREIIALLKQVKEKFGTGILFISHDMKAVENLADRVYVMYAGYLVESFDGEDFKEGKVFHPYTQKLLQSRPSYTRDYLPVLKGNPPALSERQAGCPFAPRCPESIDECRIFDMSQAVTTQGHRICCIRWEIRNENT